jgi:hypothetical protein
MQSEAKRKKTYRYRFEFWAANDDLGFTISTTNEAKFSELVNALIEIFAKIDEQSEKVVVDAFNQNSPMIRQQISFVTKRFGEKLPQLNALDAFFRRLKEGEHFCFFPNVSINQEAQFRIGKILVGLSEGKSNEEIMPILDEVLTDVYSVYEINNYGRKRRKIGEAKKEKRICRFCFNNSKPLSFKKEAHAIPEGLGNKTLILLEECDSCNEKFNISIEQNIINYLKLYRKFYGVKGKSGEPQYKGKNFSMERGDGNEVMFKMSGQNAPSKSEMPPELKLETTDLIQLQNVYKCLCKFFLSVVDKSLLPNFSKTIDWITSDSVIETLPKIAETISYRTFSTQPILRTYIRTNNNKSLPYAVGHFSFTCWTMVFIVPSSNQDNIDFTKEIDYQRFWNFFDVYHSDANWKFSDFSDNKKKNFIININFELRKIGPKLIEYEEI